MRPLRDSVAKFVSHYLNPSSIDAEKVKFFHDPLWGTIEVQAHEQCILDTPLVQRLRQIHQTGFVYQTFPSARHTRFEHTLGVMHMAGRMARTLRSRYPRFVDNTTEQRVRLAGLLHDVGHSAFSHTSEEVYSQCHDILTLLAPRGEFEGKGAGEVMSYLIVTSKPFRNFFTKVKKAFPELKVEVDDFASLIISRPARPDKLFEKDIISGPFDADKLDYFPRDGRAAGIELSLDIERLHHCLEISKVSRAHAKGTRTKTQVLVANRGGFTAIQQLLFARATLFSSVYHHHKVRACDCMVKGCFEFFRDSKKSFKANVSFPGVDLSSAADFLFVTDSDFFSEAHSYAQGDTAHKLIHNLLYRRLLKRVLTISTHTLNPLKDEQEASQQKAGYGEFFNQRSDPTRLRSLAKTVNAQAKHPCSDYEVLFDIPTKPSFGKAGEALINLASRGKPSKLKPLSEIIPVEKWVDTYQQYYAQSFLFGPPDKQTRIKLACAGKAILKQTPFCLDLSDDAIAPDIRDAVLAAEAADPATS